jgi:hypothetical protein
MVGCYWTHSAMETLNLLPSSTPSPTQQTRRSGVFFLTNGCCTKLNIAAKFASLNVSQLDSFHPWVGILVSHWFEHFPISPPVVVRFHAFPTVIPAAVQASPSSSQLVEGQQNYRVMHDRGVSGAGITPIGYPSLVCFPLVPK